MKKSFFRKEDTKSFFSEINDGIVVAAGPSLLKFRNYLNKSPKRTLLIMFLIVTANFLLFLYTNRHSKSAYDISDIYSGKMVKDQFPSAPNTVPFTLDNFQKMSAIQDSLEVLMQKKNMTTQDTLLLMKLFRQYSQLDTTFKIPK